jgi:hypothetical protein
MVPISRSQNAFACGHRTLSSTPSGPSPSPRRRRRMHRRCRGRESEIVAADRLARSRGTAGSSTPPWDAPSRSNGQSGGSPLQHHKHVQGPAHRRDGHEKIAREHGAGMVAHKGARPLRRPTVRALRPEPDCGDGSSERHLGRRELIEVTTPEPLEAIIAERKGQ